MKMNRFKNLLTMFAFSLLILGLPAIASAQWGNNRNDGYYGGNRNGGIYDERNMRNVLNRLEDRSYSFARRLDRELDNSRYNDTRREDRIDDLAGDFRDAVDRLEDNFDAAGNYGRDDSYREAQRVLSLGNRLENVLRRARLSYNLQNEWNAIRQDLRIIQNYYGNNYRRNTRNYPNNQRRGW
jgi:hypothetical protein